MTSSEVVVRRATPAEVAVLAPGNERPTMKAWVGAIPGSSPESERIVGFGGLAFSRGRWIAFCELSNEARRYKRAIIRAGRNVLDAARRDGHSFVYAQADADEPMARRWLESLGFQPDKKTGLDRWQA
jgi:hypothetical protein